MKKKIKGRLQKLTWLERLTEENKKTRDGWDITKLFVRLVPFHPNTITLIRFFLVGVSMFFFSYVWPDRVTTPQFFLILIAGLTDWIDGSKARLENKETWVGKIIDPIADDILGLWIVWGILWTTLPPILRWGFILPEALFTFGAGIFILHEWLVRGKTLEDAVNENVYVNFISRIRFALLVIVLLMWMVIVLEGREAIFSLADALYLPLILVGLALSLGILSARSLIIQTGKTMLWLGVIFAFLHSTESIFREAALILSYVTIALSILELISYPLNLWLEKTDDA